MVIEPSLFLKASFR